MKTSLICLALASVAAVAHAQVEDPSPATSPGANAKVALPQSSEAPSTPATRDQPPASSAAANPAGQAPPDQTAQTAAPAAPIPARGVTDGPQASTKGAPESGQKAYVLGPLDVIIVKIWNMDKLSGTYSIGADGMLSMPLVTAAGPIKAAGLTTKQLGDVITQRLKDCCLNNPEGQVDVQLGKNNSKRYSVYGAVGRQGEYPLDREDTTVMDAMAQIGGFKDFAKRKKIRILRGTKTFFFNYDQVSKGKHPEQNIVLQNGDRIFVDE